MYSHRQQVLDLVASPTSTQQFLSAHVGDDGASGCTLWNMQDLHSAVVMTLTSPLEALATFPEALAGNCSGAFAHLLFGTVHISCSCFLRIFSTSRCYSADFKRSHQDFIYCAGISGVSAHAIAAGAAREASKGDASLIAIVQFSPTHCIQSCNEERAHLRPRRCGCAAW